MRRWLTLSALLCSVALLSAQAEVPVTFEWDSMLGDSGIVARVERNGVVKPCGPLSSPTSLTRRCVMTWPTGTATFRASTQNADGEWGPWSESLTHTVGQGARPGEFTIRWHAELATPAPPPGGRMPRFGDETAGGDTFPCSLDRALLSLFTLTEAGDVTSIEVRFDATSSAGNSFKGLIYANAAGVPGSRIAVGAAVAIPAGGGVLSSAVTVSLPPGDYWLGYVTNGDVAVAQVDVSGGSSRMEGTTYASPAATWTESGTSGSRVNVYAEYVPSAIVQGASAGVAFDPSVSATFGADVTAGNRIVACVRGPAAINAGQITDSQGNTYTADLDPTVTVGFFDVAVYSTIATSTGPLTVTVTSFGRIGLGVYELAGVGAPSPSPVWDENASSNSPDTGALTPADAGGVAVACVGYVAQTPTWETDYQWRQLTAALADGRLLAGARILGSTAAETASATMAASDAWAALLVYYPKAAGGAGAARRRRLIAQ